MTIDARKQANQRVVNRLGIAALLMFGFGFALVPPAYQDTTGLDWMSFFWQDTSRTASALSLLVIYCAQTALQVLFGIIQALGLFPQPVPRVPQ